MQLSFDLISDLHIETWPDEFDWTGMSTSMIAVVAGDISRDRDLVQKTLTHLGQCYRAVLYIDGNDEHRFSLHDLGSSYKNLYDEIGEIENVVYLQDNVAVVDGVGFIGTNGWWTYDFENPESYDDTKKWFCERYTVDNNVASQVEIMAMQDAGYLFRTIKKLQTHQDVKKIVVVTHTVPDPVLVQHDLELQGSFRSNCVGNSHILKVLVEDTEHKIDTWCFGHYHSDIDVELHGIRFVNNCRGRGNTPWKKSVYNPKKIKINL